MAGRGVVFIAVLLFARTASAADVNCDLQSTAILAAAFGYKCHTAAADRNPVAPSPDIIRMVTRIAQSRGIDPKLALAVIAAESGFNIRAVSPRNAKGLMQLMPETIMRFAVSNPFNAEENIRAGTNYLALLLQRFGNLKLALAAYNAGEAAVLAYGNVPPFDETSQYVERVTKYYEIYRRGH